MFNFKECPKYVINLQRRKDRFDRTDVELKKHGLSAKLWRAVDANDVTVPELSIKNKESNAKGIYACAVSHISLISDAKEIGFDYLCIFEDDIILSNDFYEGIKDIESYSDWDIAYIGGHGHAIKEVIGENLYRVENCAGTYGYILKNTTFDYILRNWNYNFGIDEFLGNYVQKQFNTIARWPFIVGTYPNESDVAGHFVDYKIDPVCIT